MITGKHAAEFEGLKSDIKSRENEISTLKDRIKAYEELIQELREQRDEIVAGCGFAIDYKALNVFSIERTVVPQDSEYKYDREATNIGYLIDGEVFEWCFRCSRETHERLVKEFNEYVKTRNLAQTGA